MVPAMALPPLLCLSLITCACNVLLPASNPALETRSRFGQVGNKAGRSSGKQGYSASAAPDTGYSGRRGSSGSGDGGSGSSPSAAAPPPFGSWKALRSCSLPETVEAVSVLRKSLRERQRGSRFQGVLWYVGMTTDDSFLHSSFSTSPFFFLLFSILSSWLTHSHGFQGVLWYVGMAKGFFFRLFFILSSWLTDTHAHTGMASRGSCSDWE